MRYTDLTPTSSYHCQILSFLLPGWRWLSKQRVPDRWSRFAAWHPQPHLTTWPRYLSVSPPQRPLLCALSQTSVKWQYMEEAVTCRSLTWRTQRKSRGWSRCGRAAGLQEKSGRKQTWAWKLGPKAANQPWTSDCATQTKVGKKNKQTKANPKVSICISGVHHRAASKQMTPHSLLVYINSFCQAVMNSSF